MCIPKMLTFTPILSIIVKNRYRLSLFYPLVFCSGSPSPRIKKIHGDPFLSSKKCFRDVRHIHNCN